MQNWPRGVFFIVKYTFFAFSCEKLGHQKIADLWRWVTKRPMATTRTLLSLVVVTCACTEMVAMTTSESKERVSFVAKQRAFAWAGTTTAQWGSLSEGGQGEFLGGNLRHQDFYSWFNAFMALRETILAIGCNINPGSVHEKGGGLLLSVIPLRMGSGGSKKGTAEDNRLAAAGAG